MTIMNPLAATDYMAGVLHDAINHLYREHDVKRGLFGVATEGFYNTTLVHYDSDGRVVMTDTVVIRAVGDMLFIRTWDREQGDWSSETQIDNESNAKGFMKSIASVWLGLGRECCWSQIG